MRDTLKLGRVGGVTVGVNWSLLALAGAVAYLLSVDQLPKVVGYPRPSYWVAGALTALGLLVGVLVHEIAHAVTARRAGMQVDGITLWFMGGLTRIEGESTSPLSELWIALVGPLASGVVGGASLGLAAASRHFGWDLAGASLDWLGAINILLGLFNLLPASPLDGGRVLHGILWAATRNRWLATRLAAGAGTVLGMTCLFGALTLFEARDSVDAFTVGVTGWFILSSAKREQIVGRAQHVLGDARVSDVMRPAVIAPGWLTAGTFWSEWVARYPEAAFLLENWGGDGWSGVVTAQQLAAVPPGLQGSVRAKDVALALPAQALAATGQPSAPAATADEPYPDGPRGADSTPERDQAPRRWQVPSWVTAARSGPGPQAPLHPDEPALAIAGRAGAALLVEDHGATVGIVLTPDVLAMVARGTPVPRRTWASLWPGSPAHSSSGWA